MHLHRKWNCIQLKLFIFIQPDGTKLDIAFIQGQARSTYKRPRILGPERNFVDKFDLAKFSRFF